MTVAIYNLLVCNSYLCTGMVNCSNAINVKLGLLNNFHDIVWLHLKNNLGLIWVLIVLPLNIIYMIIFLSTFNKMLNSTEWKLLKMRFKEILVP